MRRRLPLELAITAAVLVACFRPGWAAPDERIKSTVLIDLVPAGHVEPWRAAALEQSIQRELSSYRRIAVTDQRNLGAHSCGSAQSCLVDFYRGANVDIVMFGAVGESSLDYDLYETWTPAMVSRGSIDIATGSSLVALKQQMLHALRPFLRQGGLLDQKPFLTGVHGLGQAFAPAAGTGASRRFVLGWVLVGLGLLFALPIAVLGRRSLRRAMRLPAVRVSLLLIPSSFFAAVATWGGDFLDTLGARIAPAPMWLVGIAGGMAWGWFLLDSLRFAFAPLHGLDRVGHQDVFRLIKHWSYASIQRAFLLAAYYAPFVWLLLWIADLLSLPTRPSAVALAPAIFLLARLWFSSWVQCCTVYLDDRLVEGQATQNNPWHYEIHKYFMGYVRRAGWSIDQTLLRQVVFLPGKVDGIVSYGGGGIPSRIVVEKDLLLLAMGDLEEARPEEPSAQWPIWSAGVVVPQAIERAAARRRRRFLPSRRLSVAFWRRSERSRPHAEPRRKPLGQAATLLGYVVPSDPDELAPLIADDMADLDVVRELLSEHYPWLAPDPDEEDDDTDPTDKDFLFGALAREIGVIERRDNQRTTLFAACRAWAPAPSPTVGRIFAAAAAIGQRFFSRYPAIVADAYAALHFARHHLLQYLFYRRSRQRPGGAAAALERLTARATPYQLSLVSEEILRLVGSQPCDAVERQLFRASTRNRLVWLSQFFPAPIDDPREARLRTLTAVAIALAVAASLGIAVHRAVHYYPVYRDRIAAQQAAPSDQDDQPHYQPASHGEKAK